MAKYSSFGTALTKGSYPGTEVAQVTNISGLNVSLDTTDVTEHDGTGWEEHVATILRSGTVTIDIVYDPNEATHKNAVGGLIYDLANRVLGTWNIVFPTSPVKYISFSAFVTGFTPSAPVDGALTASVTLKPSGAVTLP